MTTSVMSFRMDSDLKKAFSNLCDEIGMSVSTAFTVFAKSAVRKNKLPLDLSIEEKINGLDKAIAEMNNGEYETFENFNDLMASVKNDA